MTSSAESPSTSMPEVGENNLQPFFVLHKASTSQKSTKKFPMTGKTRRRIELPDNCDKLGAEGDGECDDRCNVNARMEAFETVWSKIEAAIKSVLRDMNTNAFNEIHQWIGDSFNTIMSLGMPSFAQATRSFPILTDATSKRLFTGLVLTKNLEFVDDLVTFEELGLHLKSQGCHFANLSSLDFSVKNGIGGCLKSLLRQFLMVYLDVADMSILATWYREQGGCDKPVVIIIDDMERCCGSALSEFILMLSEWVLKIPIILIMGVATTHDALKNLLSSSALHHLLPCKFIFGTPVEKMDAVVEAILLKQCYGFYISHKVAVFLRNYFVRKDGTITSFIRALKMACAQHFFSEPPTVPRWFLLGDNSQILQGETRGLFPEAMLKYAFDLPSYGAYERNKIADQNVESFVNGLSELKKLHHMWSTVVLCLHEVGKYDKVRLLDIFCDALDPLLYNSRTPNADLEKDSGSPSGSYMRHQYPSFKKAGFICQAVCKVRDLAGMQLLKLLMCWEKHTVEVPQIHNKVKELLSLLKSEDCNSSKHDLKAISRRHVSQGRVNTEKDSTATNEKAANLLECMIREYMRPIECIAFHELVCFKNVDKLQAALMGDPRRGIQIDLIESQNIINCSCCNRSNALVPSVHDSSIMYALAQDHGDLISLHDWYQSFKSIVLSPIKKKKHPSKHSPSPKKRKVISQHANPSEASIQARFCRAVTELQVTGLLRMPSKRRPDFVYRVAFGL